MQTYWTWLDQTIAERLNGGAIGRPVFLRATLQLTHDHGLLTPVLAGAVTTAAGWMNAGVTRLFVRGSVRDGGLSAMVEFSNGQSALISSHALLEPQPSVGVLILGQNGSVKFDDLPEPSQLGPGAPPSTPALRNAVERAIATGQPIRLERN